jgi:hypothetical protein
MRHLLLPQTGLASPLEATAAAMPPWVTVPPCTLSHNLCQPQWRAEPEGARKVWGLQPHRGPPRQLHLQQWQRHTRR